MVEGCSVPPHCTTACLSPLYGLAVYTIHPDLIDARDGADWVPVRPRSSLADHRLGCHIRLMIGSPGVVGEAAWRVANRQASIAAILRTVPTRGQRSRSGS